MPRLRLTYYSLLVFLTALLVSAIANAQTVVVPSVSLDAVLDVDHCDSAGSVLCGGSGSSGAAAVGNDSVIAVYVQVKLANGLPVGGLAESAFATYAIANPPLGVSPAFVSSAVCAACFAEQTTGVYRLAMRPSSGNWSSGTYVVLLQVTGSGGATRQLLLPVDIPN
ncbi:MAG: hypothetical protein ACFCUT_11760 [Kiloniellaceae bacterium]